MIILKLRQWVFYPCISLVEAVNKKEGKTENTCKCILNEVMMLLNKNYATSIYVSMH